MQGEYLIDAVHNVALQLGPLPGDRNALIERLKRIGFFQFTANEVKISSSSLFAAPAILKKILLAEGEVVKQLGPELLCGASPMGTALTAQLCVQQQIPMLFRGKESDRVGIHGDYFAGQRVLLIDDILFSVDEVLTTAYLVRREKLLVTDALVILDATERGKEQLLQFGVRLHSLFSIEEFLPNRKKS